MKRFPEKRALVTGAGSGLGRAICLALAERQWKIAIADIDAGRVAATAADVVRAGGQALEVGCDVTRIDALERAAESVQTAWGGTDLLVNNAGVAAYGDIETIPVERWQWIININLMGVIYGCKTFIPMMAGQGGGHIVNVASYLAFVSAPGSVCYNLTKAGILSLSETLRIELTKKNIGVSVAMPSFFQTNLMDQLFCPDQEQTKMVRTLFDRSTYTAEQVADCIVRAVDKNRFYVLPQWDAKVLWRLKRWLPNLYLKGFGQLYRRDVIQKILGI